MPRKQALYYKNRPLSLAKLSYVKKWINKILNKGFIRKLISLAIVLVLLAAKPSSSIQICHNYQGLNTVTIKNQYPLLLIYKILDVLYSTKYFIKLDVIAVFN